jgi:hypothetical protein
MQTGLQYIQADRHADRYTVYTSRQAGRQVYSIYKQTGRQTGIQYIQADRQEDRNRTRHLVKKFLDRKTSP